VLNDSSTRIRTLKRYTLLSGLAFSLSASRPMHASALMFTRDCSASGNAIKCYLSGVLSFLFVVAVALAVPLIAVIALAVRSYRKSKMNEKVGP
jgi:hypothetical protein